MTVKEIVKEYLKENGFHGLVHEDSECGCERGDLIPCCENMSECEPGYKVKCNCGDNCNWRMMTPEAIKLNVAARLLALVGIDIEWRHH